MRKKSGEIQFSEKMNHRKKAILMIHVAGSISLTRNSQLFFAKFWGNIQGIQAKSDPAES